MNNFLRRQKFNSPTCSATPPGTAASARRSYMIFIASPSRRARPRHRLRHRHEHHHPGKRRLAGHRLRFSPRAPSDRKTKTAKQAERTNFHRRCNPNEKSVRTIRTCARSGLLSRHRKQSGLSDPTDRILAPSGYWLMYGFFKPAPHLSGPGLVEADIDLIQPAA
jgi:hypothetical protein